MGYYFGNRFFRRVLLLTALIVCLFVITTFPFQASDIFKITWKLFQRSAGFFRNIFVNFDESVDFENPECNFITFHELPGRLANRMFTYASLYGLARTNRKTPFLSSNEFLLKNYFNLSIKYENISLNSFVRENERGCCNFYENITRLDCDTNVTLNGFLQSYKYFDKFKKAIKREYTFLERVATSCDRELRAALKILSNGTYSRKRCFIVGAHMRRGDFVQYQHKGYVPAESEYMLNSIQYFEKRFAKAYGGCVLFLITGNDHDWNTKNAPIRKWNVLVLPQLSAEVDLCILSRCNGTIMSSGSFGWWAAYLAGGPTVYMSNQCRPNSTLCTEFQLLDYINPTWDWHAM